MTRAIEQAIRGSAPAQFNIPGDMLTKVLDVELHACETPERPPGGPKSTLVAPSVQHDFLVALVAPSVGPKSTLLELSNGHIQGLRGLPSGHASASSLTSDHSGFRFAEATGPSNS